jgi:hypothetical protein
MPERSERDRTNAGRTLCPDRSVKGKGVNTTVPRLISIALSNHRQSTRPVPCQPSKSATLFGKLHDAYCGEIIFLNRRGNRGRTTIFSIACDCCTACSGQISAVATPIARLPHCPKHGHS